MYSDNNKKVINPYDYSEIYVHFPFCAKKCLYCDFLSFDSCSDEIKKAYIKALCGEIKSKRRLVKQKVKSIYFGGGTPSLLPASYIEKVLSELRKNFKITADAEITIEVNPGTFEYEKAIQWKNAGINRVSVGIQSFNDELLKKLGRIHNSEQAERAVKELKEAGFENISLDLMFGLPGQDCEDFKKSLLKAIELNPSHISLYSLIIEENTPFFELYNGKCICDEDEERSMAHLACDILAENGIYQYEISNFAKPGFESLHNSGYWKGVQYFGIGLGASSCIYAETSAVRFSNGKNLESYLEDPTFIINFNLEEELEKKELEKEFMLLGLRMNEGISKTEFARRFDDDVCQVFEKEIQKHIESGLLVDEGANIHLSDRGRDLANQVFVSFV